MGDTGTSSQCVIGCPDGPEESDKTVAVVEEGQEKTSGVIRVFGMGRGSAVLDLLWESAPECGRGDAVSGFDMISGWVQERFIGIGVKVWGITGDD